jgi:hypothetical protein
VSTRIPSIAALVFTLAASAPAWAQSPAEINAARQAFKEGEEAERKGDYARALARFEAALKVKSTPQLHLRAGACQERLGQLTAALASYERGLAKARETSNAPVTKVAEEQIAALRPRIPTVTITVPARLADASVKLDGAPVSPSALAGKLPVDPGPHRVHAEAPGYQPRDFEFTATERQASAVEVDLTPVGGTTAAAAAAPPPPAPSKLPGALLTAGGGAMLAGGVALLVVSFLKDGSINDLCGGPERLRCPASRKDAILADVSAANAMRFSGIGVAAAGVGVGVAGVYLLVRKPPVQSTGAVRAFPIAGPGALGLAASGAF